MKKIISAILSVALCMGMVTAAKAAVTEINDGLTDTSNIYSSSGNLITSELFLFKYQGIHSAEAVHQAGKTVKAHGAVVVLCAAVIDIHTLLQAMGILAGQQGIGIDGAVVRLDLCHIAGCPIG